LEGYRVSEQEAEVGIELKYLTRELSLLKVGTPDGLPPLERI